jgi:hypothetical protein
MDSLPPIALDAPTPPSGVSRVGVLRPRIARLLIVIAPLVVGLAQARESESARSNAGVTALPGGREKVQRAPHAPRALVPVHDTWTTTHGHASMPEAVGGGGDADRALDF